MATHQYGRKQLNMREDLRRSVLRNQAVTFIKYGFLQTTKARVKAVQQMVEKLVTVARHKQDFNAIRRVRQALPFDLIAVKKLVYEIAPKYANINGGYTRVLSMGTRMSDTAKIARLVWAHQDAIVETEQVPSTKAAGTTA